jgi:hypothetical protein
MKKIIILACALFASYSYADVNTNASSGSIAGAGASVGQSFDNHSVVQATDLSNAVGIATAPALTTTLTETCMGSTSAGAGFAGGSFSFGTTWRDSSCTRRLDARQMSAFGDVAVAREMMCDSELVREAAVRAGRPCVADGGKPWGVPVALVQQQVVPSEETAAAVVTEQVRE